MPALIVRTERFRQLSSAMMRSQQIPASQAIEIMGNPEFVKDDELEIVAQRVTGEVIRRLSEGGPVA